MLFRSVDWILLDLTGMKANVGWKLEECKRLKLLYKVVFIAGAREERNIRERISSDIADHIIFYGTGPDKEAENVLFRMARRLAHHHAGAFQTEPVS